ncbi:MAG: MFS transporter, partial [Shimia sp.]
MRHPSPFARFAASVGLVNLADGVALVAWAWLATLLTRDPLFVALVPLSLRLPPLFFALYAGLVADRVDRFRLMIWMDALRGAAFLAVGAVLLTVPLAPPPEIGVAQWGLYALIVVAGAAVGTAETFRDIAATTVLPALVPPARYESANGQLGSLELVGNSLVGPAGGAFLIAVFVAAPFLANAAAYALAVALVASLGPRGA